MRKLKFRAWVSDFEYYTYDIQERKDMFEWFEQPTINIEQYTGLKDKHDKEIYEGDLIKCYTQEGYPVGRVTYSEIWAEYEIVDCDNYSLEHFGMLTNGDLEVVGNIHENGDLLKEEK